MSRSDHSKGCPNGRDCGVCSPGKGVEAVLPRDRRRLQDPVVVEEVSFHDLMDDFSEDEPSAEEWANWDEYLYPDDAGMDLWDSTLSDGLEDS